MNKPIIFRHYCGELIRVEVFYSSHGEIVPAFFNYYDIELNEVIHNCPNPHCNEELDLDYCGSPWLIEPMPYALAAWTSKHKFCSNCWAMTLEIETARDVEGNEAGFRVVCIACKEGTQGYVSEYFIRAQQSEDYIHFTRDAESISEALEIEVPEEIRNAPSEEENIRALGY